MFALTGKYVFWASTLIAGIILTIVVVSYFQNAVVLIAPLLTALVIWAIGCAFYLAAHG